MEKKKLQIEQDIAYANNLLSETKELQQVNLDNLNLIKSNIDSRKDLLKTIDAQLVNLSAEIAVRQKKVSALYDNLSQLKDNYAKMIRIAYHHKNSYSMLMYILASEDVNQAYRRMSYFKKFSEAHLQQAKEISVQSKQLDIEISGLQKNKLEQETLMNQKSLEILKLADEEKNYEQEIEKLRQKESELRRELEIKMKRSILLDQQIKVAIAEETRKAAEEQKKSRERAQAAGEKKVAPSVVADSRFEKLKGKLLLPVKQGAVITHFGIYDHPVLRGIRITSNGIDISTNTSSPVMVVADGVVRKIFSTGSVTSILVQHDVYYTVYTRVTNVKVAVGDMVRIRQVIASTDVNNGRSILHFELWKQTDKQDPERWFASGQ
ncbi:hypothetical protein AGMMS4956_03010 [Bacteroidia bacterium]|nr:hypothetical protein AGMMS4956_03010 [Bacteroidia bacterium]